MRPIKKRDLLACCEQATLKKIAEQHELPVRTNAAHATLLEAVMAKRSIKIEQHVLPVLKLPELKLACETMGLSAKGTKAALVARLLGQEVSNAEHKSDEASPKTKAHASAKARSQTKKLPSKNKKDQPAMANEDSPQEPKAKKAAARKTNVVSFEETLWASANKLRGSVESSEYKHIVLSLIFLKFISDKFEARRQALLDDGKEPFIDMVEFYTSANVFYLAPEARWQYVMTHSKQDDIALKIDTALHTIEKSNPSLAGALPDNYFSRLGLEVNKLAALLDTINNIETMANECELSEEDLVGRVYEYFLGKFAATEGKGGGEFYTPKSVVSLLAEMLEPYKGKIYDPCCGSGGMFVQSIKFVNSHNGNQKDISIYGQEYTNTTYKLAKMNLAIRGINGNLGDVAGDTFFKDQHPDLKADYIMANPPFNQSDWRAEAELTDDPRWRGYTTPPTGNANYAWILHMLSKLSESGTAGFVLANGAMSSNTSGEGVIRQELIENDHVDCMIALPGQLFYTTQIPVCLWFLTKNKREDKTRGYRNREGETLFIDARQMGSMASRIHKEFTADDIQKIAQTYHAWRGEKKDGEYSDVAGFCKSANLEEIKANDYVLTPGRYVGAAPIADDGTPFEVKMRGLSQTLYEQMNLSVDLDCSIKKSLGALGYGE